MRNNRVVAVAVVVGMVIIGVTFLGAAKPDDNKQAQPNPKLIRPVRDSSTGVIFFGTFDNENRMLPIFPETLPQPSRVVKVHFKEGDFVHKNDVLIECDTQLADLTELEAQAGLEKAEASLKQAQATVELADQAIKAHANLIEETGLRVQSKQALLSAAETELSEKRRTAQALGIKESPDIKKAEKQLEAAQKELDAERTRAEFLKKIDPAANKRKAQGSVDEANAAVRLQKAQLNKAKYGQKLMVIRAPVNGKVVRSFVSEGTTFGVQTRQPALELQPEGVMMVRAEVDQEWASRVAVGQEASIQDDGNSNLRWKGKVTRVCDNFLPKRPSAGAPESFTLTEAKYLECIVSVDEIDPKAPPRPGQRVKVGIGID